MQQGTRLWMGLAVSLGLATAAWGETSDDLARASYMSACSSCHGASGKGDGPLKAFLVKAPSDLTTLAKRNGGAVPVELLWEMIDGRSMGATGPHGSREMPVWGRSFRADALDDPLYAKAPEWRVRTRILALIDYLQRIQAN